ncbi:glycosyltransferase family 4 protein [Tepidanaerobacter sp. EBM-49]|uniref:glycosyltransferase family 4 protein n=1 Tax=Tepidanaerobacter sp. EBM-49 TaxID=1918504 RepID=UPI00257C0441|nr:glycosyltransferase family 4 protein [Tepidanaerobacter sp. EBM-49]
MKIAIVTAYADKIMESRYELVISILKKGHSIEILGCEPEEVCNKVLNEFSVNYTQLPFTRSNTNPFRELEFIRKASKILKFLKIDMIIVYGVRLAASVSIAAKIAGVRNIYAIINGAGTLFNTNGIKGRLIQVLSWPLLTIGLNHCQKVLFQNDDDRRLFVNNLLVKRNKTLLVNGSGVNLEKYAPFSLPKDSSFLMIGRMLRNKGVFEYLDAARIVKSKYPYTKFTLIGPYDENPTAIKKDDLKPFIQAGIVKHVEWTSNIYEFLISNFVFVLPSYHEGTPRTVLEAMATGRPIITTDAPGCRETVIDGINGFLVPVKNSEVLAEKMIWMIEHREEAEKMGQESLKICREKFDVNKVNEIILRTMKL